MNISKQVQYSKSNLSMQPLYNLTTHVYPIKWKGTLVSLYRLYVYINYAQLELATKYPIILVFVAQCFSCVLFNTQLHTTQQTLGMGPINISLRTYD